MTPEFYREYNAAKSVPKAQKPAPDPWQGRANESALYKQITERAAKLRERRPELTREQAFAEIWSSDLSLRQAYQRAQWQDAQANSEENEDEPTDEPKKDKDGNGQNPDIDSVINKTIIASFEAFKALQGSAKINPPAEKQSDSGSVLIKYANGVRRLVSRAVARRLGNVTFLDGDEAA
jgi:NACalpha-BTF3-like transcription factor